MKAMPEEKNAPAWIQPHEKLHLDRSSIDVVKRHADFPRHGKPPGITNAERTQVFEITDKIITRILTYLARGKAILSVEEIPVLTG